MMAFRLLEFNEQQLLKQLSCLQADIVLSGSQNVAKYYFRWPRAFRISLSSSYLRSFSTMDVIRQSLTSKGYIVK